MKKNALTSTLGSIISYVILIATALLLSSGVKAQPDTLFVYKDLDVNQGEVMTIAPNTVVFFRDTSAIIVFGAIKALGTKEQPIVFTSKYDSINPVGSTWRGIIFKQQNQSDDSSIFEHCTFQYARSPKRSGGAINSKGYSNARFSDCKFVRNYSRLHGAAVYLDRSNMKFNRCLFQNNITSQDTVSSGAGMAIINSAPTLEHCTFANNMGNSVGGALIAMNCNGARIVNCEFAYNEGTTGGAAFIGYCSNMTFSGNLFHHNHGRYFGGGMALKACSFKIVNCSFIDNRSWQGGALYLSTGVSCGVYNSIFTQNHIAEGWNGPQIYIAYLESTLHFFNSVVSGGSENFGGNGGGSGFHGDWSNVIETEIDFVPSSDGLFAYSLPEGSPCINAGDTVEVGRYLPNKDICGNARISEDTVDIGAFESNYSVSACKPVAHRTDMLLFPNPASNSVALFINNPRGGEARIVNMRGQVVAIIPIGSNKTVIDLSHIASGLYSVFYLYNSTKLLIIR